MSASRDPVHVVQQGILRDVLRWALPTCAVVSLVTLSTAVATGMFSRHWSRGVPSLVFLGFSVVGLVLLRTGRPRGAMVTLIAGVGGVMAIALTFNGGLRSPTAMLVLFLIAVCGWVYGRAAATVMAVIAVLIVTLYFVLGTTGVLTEPPTLPLVGEYVMLLVLISLIWGTSAAPPSRMRSALIESETRMRALKEEQALRLEAAQQFQAVFDQSPNFMSLLSPDGSVQTINRAGLTFAGLTLEQATGLSLAQSPWWPASERSTVEQAIARAHHGMVRFQTTNLDAQGTSWTIDFSLAPFRDAAGELRFLIAEGRDITDLMLSRERKHRAQRLELVGQLAGGVAHDFNNVLMAILASTEVLRGDLAAAGHESAQLTESLETILESGRRAGELTHRLLTFGRRATLERKVLSVHALLDSTTRLLERTLPANVKLVVAPTAPQDLVDGDVASLESALLNLALNARDAMASGGTLTFSTERVLLDEDWCRSSGFELAPGAYLRLSVRDTGVGIAPENLPRVFEPFFTTKDEGKGTGLGLASVFGVVREHGGAVQVYSEPGRGTVFHLTLPLATRALVQPKPALRSRQFPGVKVLVVDDEPAIRKMLTRLLGSVGMTCTVAGSAEEGLALFDDSIDLLITDVVLPGRRGNELAAELLARRPTLRALLISGFPKDSELSTLPAERSRLLGKPFSFEALQQTLSELLPAQER